MFLLIRCLLCLVLLAVSVRPTLANLLPDDWRKALVSIEVATPAQSQTPGGSNYQAVGTGFFVTADSSPPFRAVLFTAAHVFQGVCDGGANEIYLRVEESPSIPDSRVQRYPMTICDRHVSGNNVNVVPRWVKHPSADLAAILPQFTENVRFPDVTPFPMNIVAKADDWKKWNVGEGDDVLGLMSYPNAAPNRPSSPIVRQGVIAGAGEEVDTLLLSLTVFPGNSGAPVILKPNAVHFSQAGANIGIINPTLLLGVVIEYIPYYEAAISPQTKHMRVLFEENSGLTRIVRSEKISELMTQMVPRLGNRN